MRLVISERVKQKLRDKHQVNPDEVRQCFFNRDGHLLEDAREEHRTLPPSQWFIAETDEGRRLKIVFVEDVTLSEIYIKTAYQSNAVEEKIYDKYGKKKEIVE